MPYEITEVESDRPAGEVLAQDPAPGPVPGNTVVKLTVSKGLPKVVDAQRRQPARRRPLPTSWAAWAS